MTIIGYETVGSRGYVAKLLDHARCIGVDNRFRFLGALPLRSDIFQALSNANVCLALMPMDGGDINTQSMVGASNKAFDAFCCALPIIVSDLPDWQAAYVQRGIAKSCDPRKAASIAEALEWFKTHSGERILMGQTARSFVESDWNYESQFSSVFEAMMRSDN